jgi:hypothetical protein
MQMRKSYYRFIEIVDKEMHRPQLNIVTPVLGEIPKRITQENTCRGLLRHTLQNTLSILAQGQEASSRKALLWVIYQDVLCARR